MTTENAPNTPPNIENYAKSIRRFEAKDSLSQDDKRRMAVCKLKIALWACQCEGMPITRYSLSEILGPDTSFVFQHAKNAMLEVEWESEADRKASMALINQQNQRSPAGKGDLSIYR